MTDQINNSGQPPAWQVGVFAPRNSLAISTSASPPTGLSNDANRTSRSTIQADGTVVTEQTGVVRGSVNVEGNDRSGVFQTMRSHLTHSPISVGELQPESVVRLSNGLEMQLKSALSAGYITQGADGRYATAAPRQAAPQAEVHDDLKMEPLADRNAEAALATLMSGTTASSQIAAISDIANGDELSPQRIGQLASEMRVEPGQVMTHLSPVLQAFQAQADSVVAAEGVDPQTVYQWARENQPRELKTAMQNHGNKRQTGGYKTIAQAFVLAMDKHSPEAILGADFGPKVSIRKDTVSGRIIVKTPDGEFPWSSAVRAGLIKLGRRR